MMGADTAIETLSLMRQTLYPIITRIAGDAGRVLVEKGIQKIVGKNQEHSASR